MSFVSIADMYARLAGNQDLIEAFNALSFVNDNELFFAGAKYTAWSKSFKNVLISEYDEEIPTSSNVTMFLNRWLRGCDEYLELCANLASSDEEVSSDEDDAPLIVDFAPVKPIKPVVAIPVRQQEVVPIVNTWDNIQSLDDIEEIKFDILGWISTNLPEIKLAYDFATICRTIVAVAANIKLYSNRASISGSKISDIRVCNVIADALTRCKHNINEIVQAALADNREKIEVAKVHVGKEEYSRDLRVVGDVVFNGRFYMNANASPLLQFKSKDESWEVNEGLSNLIREVGILVTSKGFRHELTLPVIKNGVVDDRIWSLSPHLRGYFEGTVKDLYATVVSVARRLLSEKITTVTGLLGTQLLPLMKFLSLTSVTHEHPLSEFRDQLKFWRLVREGTIYDTPWFKHEYLFSRCGEEILPYYATATKFLEAYNQLTNLAKQILDKPKSSLCVIYAGVTNNGDNVQLAAVVSYFINIFGECRTTVERGYDKSQRWDLIKCDIHGQNQREVISIDATSLESVLSLSPRIAKFTDVIVVLDVSDSSVGDTTNNNVATWMENFAQLKKVRFVTSKYSAVHALNVRGYGVLMPLTFENKDVDLRNDYSEMYSFPVGRTHGIEGIVFGVPSRGAGAQSMMPFATEAKKNGCSKYRVAMKKRINIGSFAQFAPKMFRDYNHEDTVYVSKKISDGKGGKVPMVMFSFQNMFPKTYGNVGKLKKSGKEIEGSVIQLFGISDVVFNISDEDTRADQNVSLVSKCKVTKPEAIVDADPAPDVENTDGLLVVETKDRKGGNKSKK